MDGDSAGEEDGVDSADQGFVGGGWLRDEEPHEIILAKYTQQNKRPKSSNSLGRSGRQSRSAARPTSSKCDSRTRDAIEQASIVGQRRKALGDKRAPASQARETARALKESHSRSMTPSSASDGE